MTEPIDLDLARTLVLSHARPVGLERCELAAAVGRYLGEAVCAPHCCPAADNSAMDGYAVRTEDLLAASVARPVELAVVDRSEAGRPARAACGPGQAIRIFTGGVIPAGADAVVVQEVARPSPDGSTVAFDQPVPVGQHVRRAGEEYQTGERLLEPGCRLRPAALGLAASAGLAELLVHRLPRVALLVTGDELVTPQALAAGSPGVVDVNTPMLLAWLTEHGAVSHDPDWLPDQTEPVADWLNAAVDRADLVLTVGGASVGERDVLADAWRAAGLVPEFNAVAVKPGKPVRFGWRDRADGQKVLIFSLPGNPLAALTSCEQLVAPALTVLAGGRWQPPPRIRLPLAQPWSPGRMRRYLLRGELRQEGGAPVLGLPARQGSAILREAARQGLVAELQSAEPLPAGHPVEAVFELGALTGLTLRVAGDLPALCGIWGPSNSGKTRLVELLLPQLRAAGLRVGTVKHASHQPKIDTPGKDSWRHGQAGASRVLLLGPDNASLFVHGTNQKELWPWLDCFAGDVDLVLVEGFQRTAMRHVRIELVESSGFSLAAAPERPDSWVLRRPVEAPYEALFPADLTAQIAAALVPT